MVEHDILNLRIDQMNTCDEDYYIYYFGVQRYLLRSLYGCSSPHLLLFPWQVSNENPR